MDGKAKEAPVQSICKAAAILRCFYTRDELGLTELSQMVGMNKSTAAGLVISLRHEGFLTQNERGKLQLGSELFFLGSHVNVSLSDICRPYLERMLAESDETVNLAVPDGPMVAYVSKIESPHSMRICTSIGQRLPFYCTAVGKAIYSRLSEDAVGDAFAAAKPRKFTENTITDYEALRRDLVDARIRGYATDAEELEPGLVCVAAPILDGGGKPFAAVSVSGPAQRMQAEKIDRAARIVLSAAAEISARYSYRAVNP